MSTVSRGKALALSALTVTIATFLGRIFGFVREVAIANKFGATAQTDAFLVAFTIPNVIYSLVVMGALSASFIPIFSGLVANEKEKDAWRLATTIFNLLLIGFGAIVLALVVFAPQAISLVAPGFKSEAQVTLGANLLRLMAPALIFMGISGLIAGILNSYNHFAAPSLVALVQNSVVVVSIIAFASQMGIYGAALGLLLGSIGMVLVQVPILIKKKLPFKVAVSLKHESLTDIGKLFLPVLLALAASQANTIVDKWMASFLSDGSISHLNFAFKVGSLPLNTLIAAIAVVLFPTLSKHAARQDLEALKETIATGIRMVAFVTIPATVGLFVLSLPVVRLLFEHGAFDRAATLATAPALAVYSFGLLALGLNMLLVRAFYALKDGMMPLLASVIFLVALIGLDLVFVGLFSHVGLALGYVLAASLMATVLLAILGRRLRGLLDRQMLLSMAKVVAAAAVMWLATWLVSAQLEAIIGGSSKLFELLVVLISLAVGVGSYVVALVLLKADEVAMLWQIAKSKISRSAPQAV